MMTMSVQSSVLAETTALTTAAIPEAGRKIGYRGYLIHGEIPGICYAIYGRNPAGRLAELGAVSGFKAAMRWVDRHIAELEGIMPAYDAPMPAAGESRGDSWDRLRRAA